MLVEHDLLSVAFSFRTASATGLNGTLRPISSSNGNGRERRVQARVTPESPMRSPTGRGQSSVVHSNAQSRHSVAVAGVATNSELSRHP